MFSTLCCPVNELLYTSWYKSKQPSRDGFVVNVRNLGVCQLGISQNGGSKLLSANRKCCSVEMTERLVSVVEDVEEQHSFTVSYLINSCGLSPELAISASKKVKFTTPDRPDSVLALLRDYGFESTHIAKLVRKHPTLLLARPDTFIPKLEFFRTMGISDCKLANVCSSAPNMFRYSLKNRIIPICDFLKSVLLVDKKVTSAISGGPRLFEFDVQHISSNIEIMKQMGAAPSVVSYMLVRYPVLFNKKSDEFLAAVNEVIRLGFNPSRLSFVQALCAINMLSKSKWEKKVKAYKSWGCSDDDIAIAFSKHPICMLISEKKIMRGMDFLVKEMGLNLSDIMKNPSLLSYSLKKRVIPRCSVVRVLQLNELLRKNLCIATTIQPTESHFLEKFVTKYEEQVPQLLSIYRGKIGLRELGFGPEDIQRIAEL